MEGRPIGATALLSAVAFVFGGTVGVWLAILFLAAHDASTGGLIAGSIALLLFAVFAVSSIYALHVSPIWPLVGVCTGFAGFIAWLVYAFTGMD